jgi:hypothetical protein
MLVDTQSSNCAFLFAIGTPCTVIRHTESCGAALNLSLFRIRFIRFGGLQSAAVLRGSEIKAQIKV